MDDNVYENLVNYLLTEQFPFDVNESNFRRKASHYRVKEKQLYKVIRNRHGELECFEYPMKNEIPKILETYHVDHPGIKTMTVSIREKYFWDNMYLAIEQFVKSCHICQTNSAKLPHPQRELQPITPPERPWQHIGIDLFVDMPENSLGYKHVLVAVCYLSKYVIAHPIRTKTTAEVVAELLKIYLTYGVPKICQHDQGREFTSKELSGMHEQLGVDDRRSSPYYPQSNGLVEAHNKILKRKIEKFRQTSDEEWPTKLPFAVLASNTKIKRATKYSAFEIMFGRKCDVIPLLNLSENFTTIGRDESSEDELTPNNSDPFACETDTVDKIGEEMSFLRQQTESEARMNIKLEQTRQKRIYDRKVKNNRSNIQEGELFLVRNVKKDKKLPNTKTQPKYIGPFSANSIGKSTLFTVNDSTQKKVAYPLHMSKKYIQHDNQSEHIAHAGSNKTTSLTTARPNNKRNAKVQSLSDCKRTKLISEQFVYGISRELIMEELNLLKEDVITSLRDQSYISPLHETLHNIPASNRQMCPTITVIFSVLKDITPFEMREEMMKILGHWTEEAYAEMYENNTLQAKHCIEYSHKVLYPVICDYLESKMIDKIYPSDTLNLPFKLPPLLVSPLYQPITQQWQIAKCQQLGISFCEKFEQQPALTGSLLRKFVPWQTEKISMDGNCFFRTISKILSGSEENHVKLRAEVCRYMISEGNSIINQYLKTINHDSTVVSYLKTSGMTEAGIWASDVEIVALSSMLDSDVYIATDQHDPKRHSTRTIWNRYSVCVKHLQNTSIYISNINHNHYEPVISLINSNYNSFYL